MVLPKLNQAQTNPIQFAMLCYAVPMKKKQSKGRCFEYPYLRTQLANYNTYVLL